MQSGRKLPGWCARVGVRAHLTFADADASREDVAVAMPDDLDEPLGEDAAGAAPSSLMGQVGRRRIRYGMRIWFRTPPRRHGEVIDEREVSFLELFYDLVYVVLIGSTTHHLAAHVAGRSVVEFAVVFGLIWLAWFNGTLVARVTWPRGRA